MSDQPTTPEPDKVIPTDPITGVGTTVAGEKFNPSTADKVCPRCHGDKGGGVADGLWLDCPDCNGTGRIAGTSTYAEHENHEYEPTLCAECVANDRRIDEAFRGTTEPHELPESPTPDVQPVSPNGDDLEYMLGRFGALYHVAKSGNEGWDGAQILGEAVRNFEALIAQRVLQGRIDELETLRFKYMPAESESYGLWVREQIIERIDRLIKDLK